MRIITGEYKGRKLEAPKGDEIRPTGDKVKEAIFSILQNRIYGSRCVDLFAGTGNLGLEALSRGAESCLFCDIDRESTRLINLNISKCGAEEKSVVVTGDFKKALKKIDYKVDVFFLDPPYKSGLYEKALDRIDSLDLLAEDGIIVAEHEKHVDLPQDVGGILCFDVRRYGKTCISLYGRR